MEEEILKTMPSPDDFAETQGRTDEGKRWQYTYVVLGSNNWFNALQAYGAQGFEVVPAPYAYNIILMRR